LIFSFGYLEIIQSPFKSLLETCSYIILRRRHITGEPNSSRTPIDSPVFRTIQKEFNFIFILDDKSSD